MKRRITIFVALLLALMPTAVFANEAESETVAPEVTQEVTVTEEAIEEPIVIEETTEEIQETEGVEETTEETQETEVVEETTEEIQGPEVVEDVTNEPSIPEATETEPEIEAEPIEQTPADEKAKEEEPIEKAVEPLPEEIPVPEAEEPEELEEEEFVDEEDIVYDLCVLAAGRVSAAIASGQTEILIADLGITTSSEFVLVDAIMSVLPLDLEEFAIASENGIITSIFFEGDDEEIIDEENAPESIPEQENEATPSQQTQIVQELVVEEVTAAPEEPEVIETEPEIVEAPIEDSPADETITEEEPAELVAETTPIEEEPINEKAPFFPDVNAILISILACLVQLLKGGLL